MDTDGLHSIIKYCKSQEEQKVMSATNHRDLQKRIYEKQYLNGSKELVNIADESKSFAIACSSNWVERNTDLKTQVPVRELRKQAIGNVFNEFGNNNFNENFTVHNDREKIECSSRTRIQTSNFCPQANKSNNIFVKRNRQTGEQEESKNRFLENSHTHTFQEISPKTEKLFMSNCNAFHKFELKDLLHYHLDLMQHEQLLDYAFAVKSKILKDIFEFKNHQDELEFLCALTDGSQTIQNQKLIIKRIHFTINKSIKETTQSSNILNSNSNTHEPRLSSVHTPNPVLTSKIDNFNILHKYNGEHLIVNKNLEHNTRFSADKHTEENNCNIESDNHKINSLKTLSNKTRGTAYLEESLESNIPQDNATESILDNVAGEEESTYGSLRLENLLNYDVEVMHGNLLIDYAFSLKKRVLENILDFKNPDRERLQILCELTDGTQSETQQKLITYRLCTLVNLFRKNRNFIPRIPTSHLKKPNYPIRRQ